MILNDQKIIFVHVPKCAGTSIESLFYANAIDKDVPGKHLTFREYRQKRKFKNFSYFTFVRNPWDRAVSYYCYRRKRNFSLFGYPSFDDWIAFYCSEDVHLYKTSHNQFWRACLTQKDFISRENGDMVATIGKTEFLPDAWDDIKCLLDIRVTSELPHINRTIRMNYRDYYNDQTRKIVEKKFLVDIDTFKYTF